MSANEEKERLGAGRGSAWPLVLGISSILVILIAMLLPRRPGRSCSVGPPAAPAGAVAAQSRHAGAEFRPDRHTAAPVGRSAQEVVAGKVIQFGHKRWETVQAMARHFEVAVPDEVRRFFEAVQAGRQEEAAALFKSMSEQRNASSTSSETAQALKKLWPAVLETYGVAEVAQLWPAQRLLDYGNAVLDSLRPGMVYAGGTDAGRFIPTLLNETSDAGQHIILTQNALADNTYLDYVRFLYGDQMPMLTADDSQRAFSDYMADATKRLQHDQQIPDEPPQLRPGEDVRMVDGKVQVSGQVSVMYINELLMQALIQKNPDAAFALQESFPFQSTYADATTLGPIMELRNADPQTALTRDRVNQALGYWGDTVQSLVADPEVPNGSEARNAYSKLLLAQANLFLDRNYAGQAEEAFRLATELAPASPEVVYKYAGLLAKEKRFAEASQLVQNALTLAPADPGFKNLLQALNRQR
jgi:tetratricopeptide (TPR) repeat protein